MKFMLVILPAISSIATSGIYSNSSEYYSGPGFADLAYSDALVATAANGSGPALGRIETSFQQAWWLTTDAAPVLPLNSFEPAEGLGDITEVALDQYERGAFLRQGRQYRAPLYDNAGWLSNILASASDALRHQAQLTDWCAKQQIVDVRCI